MRASRAYEAVGRHTSVMSSDAVGLILLVFDRLLQRLGEFEQAVMRDGLEQRRLASSAAIELIEKGLIGALDFQRGGELALRLKGQYQFWISQLLLANLHGDADLARSLLSQVKTVQSGWQELKAMNP
jgi:flagellar protein FliS